MKTPCVQIVILILVNHAEAILTITSLSILTSKLNSNMKNEGIQISFAVFKESCKHVEEREGREGARSKLGLNSPFHSRRKFIQIRPFMISHHKSRSRKQKIEGRGIKKRRKVICNRTRFESTEKERSFTEKG